MVKKWKVLVFSGEADPAVLSRATTRGTLRRLAPGVYTGALATPPEDVVRAHMWEIVGHFMPDAVLVDKSARLAGPAEGVLYVDHGRTRPLNLPGLIVSPRRGPGPLVGDTNMPHGLWISSIARQLLDNLLETAHSPKRTLTRLEVEAWVDTLLRERGQEGLNQLRDQARYIAPALKRGAAFKRLDAIVSAALSTGDATQLRSERLLARVSGQPYDERRIRTFEHLASDLLTRSPDVVAALDVDQSRRQFLPFYEAYFSNFIEGTEFTLDEASDIVLEHVASGDRPADVYDILGTYEVVSDPEEMSRTPRSSDEFEQLLKARHARLMSARSENLPGRYKIHANRAGLTEFVDPNLVRGTLRRGFEVGSELVDPFARAVFLQFVIAEVHPFRDGNGRISRIMMNAELVSAGQVRIVIPIVFRLNYLAALRAATNSEHFAALYATLAFARRYTAKVDFSSRQSAETDLRRTNALRDSNEAEDAGVRLVLP